MVKNLNSILLELSNKIKSNGSTWNKSTIDDVINDNTNLSEVFDSLGSVEFIMELEKEFGINIPDAHADRIMNEGVTLKDVKKELEVYGVIDIKEQRKDKLNKINKYK